MSKTSRKTKSTSKAVTLAAVPGIDLNPIDTNATEPFALMEDAPTNSTETPAHEAVQETVDMALVEAMPTETLLIEGPTYDETSEFPEHMAQLAEILEELSVEAVPQVDEDEELMTFIYEEPAEAAPKLITAKGELGDAMSQIDPEVAKLMVERIDSELNERQRFEETKNPNNSNIHKTIKKVRGSLARSHAAAFMIAANVSPTFLNRVLHDGSKYNVYAMQKFSDFVDGLVGGTVTNAINIACMRTLFNFQKEGLAFTGEIAKAAASDKIRISAALRKHLVSHTVSASTAPTQASSTMQALQTLGVVRVEGSRKHPTYIVCNNAVTDRLQEIVRGYSGASAEDEDEENMAEAA